MEILLILILCVICPPLGFAILGCIALYTLWNLYVVWCLSCNWGSGDDKPAKPTRPSLIERMQLDHSKRPLLGRTKKAVITDRIEPTIKDTK